MTQKLANLLKNTGIINPIVLAAMAKVDRAKFLPGELASMSDANQPLAIGEEQTCSQPYIVAKMSELLLGEKNRLENVLEIGTGCGYQAAVLGEFSNRVETIERIEVLYKQTETRLQKLGYTNIHCHYADGYQGWEQQAPYDGIIVTAAAPQIPKALKEQLADGGRLIIPVGIERHVQTLMVVEKHGGTYDELEEEAVVFVPMLTGRI